MADKNEVDQFLSDFNTKVNIWGIIYLDGRGKNAQTLLDLELRSIDRTAICISFHIAEHAMNYPFR